MTNEATCIEAPRVIKRFTCVDGVGIAKGTLLKLSGDDIIVASSGADVFGGIAIEEKTANDGITSIAVAMDGVWDIVGYGVSVTLGGIVSLSGTNVVKQATEAEMVTGNVVGKALTSGTGHLRVMVGQI